MTTQLEALNKHKANARHLKLFNQGIELFNQGVKCPIDDSAIKDGWKCGEQMRDIKIVTLSASRVKFNVD
jgi:hypothetical protein